ncbi:NOP58 family protein [Candidatus Woesearchaeota archaeon]|nr:NOP58 family protein [Candidatus Woesearchaeota archaeon]
MADGLVQLRKKCILATAEALKKAVTTDQLIIQMTDATHELHKVTNTLAKRLREWFGGWIPELEKAVNDHATLAHLVATKKYKELLAEAHVKESVGTAIDKKEEKAIQEFAQTLNAMYEEKARLLEHTERLLKEIMPNTLALCGASIAADLLSSAGSFKRFSQLPSGTVQLLGAETALFRHLQNKKHRPPKHGLIFNHQLVQRVRRDQRGKAARGLADKISLTIKVDRFKGEPCGEEMRKKLEARFS